MLFVPLAGDWKDQSRFLLHRPLFHRVRGGCSWFGRRPVGVSLRRGFAGGSGFGGHPQFPI